MGDELNEWAQAALEKWTPVAERSEPAQFGVPLQVLLGEAIEVAAMLEHYWQPTAADGKPGVGFAGITKFSQLTEKTASEIRELRAAIGLAHSHYLLSVETVESAPMERAAFVLGELRATLEFVFDDGKEDEADEQLARLQQAFPDSGSHDAMALALEGYAELASAYRDRLAELQGFDLELMTEARVLATALRGRSAAMLTNPAAQRQMLLLRNSLIGLLLERVRLVRRAAQYLFREQPEIQRRFTSAYERHQRAARRRAAKAAQEQAAEGGSGAKS